MHIKHHRPGNGFRLIIIALLLAALASGCGGGDRDGAHNKKADRYGIVLNDNAALRIDPLIYASRITLLKKGEKVEIIDQSREMAWIGKSHDYWYKVTQRKGISGWIFGGNLKIFSPSQSFTMDNYLSNLREDEEKDLRTNLTGKWWSVDRRGEFTNHCVEIFEDGKYKSFARGGKEIEGEYTINFKDTEIVFLNKTSFGQNLRYVRRGNIFTLEAEMGAREWRFKKISEGMAEPTADEVPLNGNGEKETGKDVNDANQ